VSEEHGVSGGLERRYRTLLRAYPAGYRAERGDEIVGTLLDGAADGRRRPGLREAASLILGGLRTRLGTNRLPQPMLWQHALHLAAVLMLVGNGPGAWQDVPRLTGSIWGTLWLVLPTVVALYAVVVRRYRLALAMVVLDLFGRNAFVSGEPVGTLVNQAPLIAVIAALVFLARPGAGPARGVPGVLVAVMLAIGAWNAFSTSVVLGSIPGYQLALLQFVPVLLVGLAALVDPRLSLGFGIAVLGSLVLVPYWALRYGYGSLDVSVLPYLLGAISAALVSLVVGWLAARHRARV